MWNSLSDLQITLLIVGIVAALVGGRMLLAACLSRGLRKLSGEELESSWQPAITLPAGLIFAALLLAPLGGFYLMNTTHHTIYIVILLEV